MKAPLDLMDFQKVLSSEESECLMKLLDVNSSEIVSIIEFRSGFIATYTEKLNILKDLVIV